jgi:hypothetical protein
VTNNAVIKSLCPGDTVKLSVEGGRSFTGQVTGSGKQLWVTFREDNAKGEGFTVQAPRLARCLGTLAVVR